MHAGIFSKTFDAPTVDTVFAAVREHGYRATQFNFASAGLPSLPKAVPPEAVTAIGAARENHGVLIEAVSATFNMTHPRPEVIADGLAALEAIAHAAAALGCGLLTLCTGTLDPDDQWRHHPGNDSPAAWAALTRCMEKALAVAEKYDLALGVEPELGNIVSSAPKARKLIDDMGSRRIKIIFDPANLFERVDSLAEQHRIVDDALDLLGPDIVIAHAKDRAPDGSFTTAGRGILDYPHYISGLRRVGFDGCVVTHGLPAGEAAFVAELLHRLLEG